MVLRVVSASTRPYGRVLAETIPKHHLTASRNLKYKSKLLYFGRVLNVQGHILLYTPKGVENELVEGIFNFVK